ncbi:MAG TPA: Stk1 family PASTA domain-containing Ser/Thr kinase [Acidimicrobiia bacterium]|jgi:serine/threonine-protein kinase
MASPGIFANRYEVVREIASGGMATVYLARDSKLNRLVALKVLSDALSADPAFVERFRLEAQAAANLNNPNIVAIYDWGQEHGTYFIVMEYVDGETLRHRLDTQRTIPPTQAADIAAEVAAGLAYADKHGVVHRDVKPGNVLITPGGQVKVTDFGIARAHGASDGLTKTGAVMGTATYFSPEQAQGLPVDGRSDVYSLGVVLYEMLTGTTPFKGDGPVAVAYKHVREPAEMPTQVNPAIPPQLERIVMTCLAKKPEERYQSADEVRADLLRFRRGQSLAGPMTAQVASVADPTIAMAPAAAGGLAADDEIPQKKRNPWLWLVAGLLAALLIGGLILLLTQLGGGGGGSIDPKNVVGMQVADATRTLEGQGLKVKVTNKPNADKPAGVVVSQDPSHGTKVDKGSTVDLVVSAGVGNVTIPDVSGDDFATAQDTLVGAGFKVTQQTETSATVPKGVVTRTAPPAGSKVGKGSAVTVFVSGGPAQVTIPDVTRVDAVQATQILVQKGFQVTKTTQNSSTVPAGLVISTNPPAGTSAAPGSTVQLIVSDGPAQLQVPNVVGMTQTAATNALTNLGLNVTVVQVPSQPQNNGLVISQSPTGGTSVNRGATVQITVGTGQSSTTTSSTT